MNEDFDKLLKKQYDCMTINNYNEKDISNIILKANIRKKKKLYKKIGVISVCFVITIMLLIFSNLNTINNINLDNIYYNLTQAESNSIKECLNNYGKILPKESDVIIYDKNVMAFSNSIEGIGYDKFDYVLSVKILNVIDYTENDGIVNESPKTIFRAEVIENLKGELREEIEIYADGAVVLLSSISKNKEDNIFVKYRPLSYPDIGNKYIVALNVYDSKLYVEKIQKYKE